MRTSLRFATAVASLLFVLFGVRLGMAQPAPQSGTPRGSGNAVVVIDIGHIFRNHVRFKQMMEDMKTDLQEVEKAFREKSDQITKMVESLNRYNPGSPDYNRIEEDITRARATLQADMALKKKDFMLKEAGIYSQVYDEIVQVVARFCERNSIDIVLRFSSEEIDPQNAQSVMKGINRNIVYQYNRNITYDILALMNPRTTPQPTRPQTPQDPRGQTPPNVSRNFSPVPPR